VLPASVIAAPGAATTTLTFSASSKVAAKAYPVTINAIGAGVTQTQKLTVIVGSQTASHARFPRELESR
jgi:hypothetical protein